MGIAWAGWLVPYQVMTVNLVFHTLTITKLWQDNLNSVMTSFSIYNAMKVHFLFHTTFCQVTDLQVTRHIISVIWPKRISSLLQIVSHTNSLHALSEHTDCAKQCSCQIENHVRVALGGWRCDGTIREAGAKKHDLRWLEAFDAEGGTTILKS